MTARRRFLIASFLLMALAITVCAEPAPNVTDFYHGTAFHITNNLTNMWNMRVVQIYDNQDKSTWPVTDMPWVANVAAVATGYEHTPYDVLVAFEVFDPHSTKWQSIFNDGWVVVGWAGGITPQGTGTPSVTIGWTTCAPPNMKDCGTFQTFTGTNVNQDFDIAFPWLDHIEHMTGHIAANDHNQQNHWYDISLYHFAPTPS